MIEDLKKDLSKGKFHQVYVVFGEDSYLRNEAYETILTTYKCDSVKISLKEATAQRVADELASKSLFNPNKLVILEADAKSISALEQSINEFCGRKVSGTTLVILLDESKSKVDFGKNSKEVSCNPPKRNEVVGWLIEEFKSSGKNISPQHADLIVSRTGVSLGELKSTIEKICTYLGGRKTVSENDVLELTVDAQTYKTFDLAGACAGNKLPEAMRMLHHLFMQGEPIQLIIASLGWQFRKMNEAKKLAESGVAPFDACTKAGIRFNQYAFADAIKKQSAEKLALKLSEILQADLALKSSQVDERLIMDKLVIKLAS